MGPMQYTSHNPFISTITLPFYSCHASFPATFYVILPLFPFRAAYSNARTRIAGRALGGHDGGSDIDLGYHMDLVVCLWGIAILNSYIPCGRTGHNGGGSSIWTLIANGWCSNRMRMYVRTDVCERPRYTGDIDVREDMELCRITNQAPW